MIELQAITDGDGHTRIYDQHGTEVKGVLRVTRSCGCEEATTLTLRVYEYRNGAPVVNRKGEQGRG